VDPMTLTHYLCGLLAYLSLRNSEKALLVLLFEMTLSLS